MDRHGRHVSYMIYYVVCNLPDSGSGYIYIDSQYRSILKGRVKLSESIDVIRTFHKVRDQIDRALHQSNHIAILSRLCECRCQNTSWLH